jgi:hypothetical protein
MVREQQVQEVELGVPQLLVLAQELELLGQPLAPRQQVLALQFHLR